MTEERVKPTELSDWLVSHGRHWVTIGDIETTLNLDRQEAWNAVADLKRRGMLFTPARGAYVPVPPEYRSWGVVPAAHFVDPMMRYLDRRYYVGLLSAAEIHGSAHQRPQVFQVVTDRQLSPKHIGRVRIAFYTSRRIHLRPTIRQNTPTGTMFVSTPEVTILDLTSWPYASGGFSNVGTICAELSGEGKVNPSVLAEVAEGYPRAVASRAGWVLDQVDSGLDLSGLHAVASRRKEPVPLSPAAPSSGELDVRWNVQVNTDFEPEH